MKIDLENRQSLLRTDRRTVETLVRAFLLRPGPPVIAFSRVTVVLTADAEMRGLKRDLFGEDVVTDVISLAYTSIPGEDTLDATADLYVNVEQALRVVLGARGEQDRQAVARELVLYLAHGIDHLRGGDDATPAGRAAMRRRDLRWVRWAATQGLLAKGFEPPRSTQSTLRTRFRRARPAGAPPHPHTPTRRRPPP